MWTVQSDALREVIQTRKFYIYGNGYIARRFYRCLLRIGYERNVLGVAVTVPMENEVGVNGHPVICIDGVERECCIMLAVHEVNLEEMENALQRLGFRNVTWIYPCLLELECGQPCGNELIGINIILQACSISYTPAIYYLSIKKYCQDARYDGTIYLKCQAAYSTIEVAEKRWYRFKRKIDACMGNGYVLDAPVKITRDGFLLDGIHRLALAKYFGIENIKAYIYAIDGRVILEGDLRDIVMVLRMEELLNYYTAEEIQYIREAHSELHGK